MRYEVLNATKTLQYINCVLIIETYDHIENK